MAISVEFIKTVEGAQAPTQAHPGEDVGWDLYVLDEVEVCPGDHENVRSGIAIALPVGYFARIVGRSSTIRQRGLILVEGIIDAGFRGELFSGVFNPGPVVRRVSAGERLAQVIIQPVIESSWQLVDNLPPSARGESGFGSSGL